MINTSQVYYYYNKKAFDTRESAFEEMLLNDDYQSTVQFHFNEHVFRKINWRNEPTQTIDELYRLRAQQLRDTYSYLILAFSGGSDSTQILKTFLRHNIFIDEIQVIHHSDLKKRIDEKELLTDNEFKQFMEYDYAVVPMLKEVHEKSPQTKITTLDLSQYVYDQYVKGQFSLIVGNSLVPATHAKLYSFMPRTFSYYLAYYNLVESPVSENACIIRGFEKPIIDISEDGKMLCSFSDMVMSSRQKEITSRLNIEDFYWSQDFPLIPIKQAHLIKRALETDKSFYSSFIKGKQKIKSHTDINTYSPAIIMERLYCGIIYPDWNPYTFVAPKPTKIIPELKLIDRIGEKQHTLEFIKDIGKEKEGRFAAIANKKQFRNLLFTKPHTFGDFTPSWIIF